MAPYDEGETIGFRDAQLLKVSEQRELNFLLTPFLSRQVPSSMKVNAADLLRRSLEGSTATSGYKVRHPLIAITTAGGPFNNLRGSSGASLRRPLIAIGPR